MVTEVWKLFSPVLKCITSLFQWLINTNEHQKMSPCSSCLSRLCTHPNQLGRLSSPPVWLTRSLVVGEQACLHKESSDINFTRMGWVISSLPKKSEPGSAGGLFLLNWVFTFGWLFNFFSLIYNKTIIFSEKLDNKWTLWILPQLKKQPHISADDNHLKNSRQLKQRPNKCLKVTGWFGKSSAGEWNVYCPFTRMKHAEVLFACSCFNLPKSPFKSTKETSGW